MKALFRNIIAIALCLISYAGFGQSVSLNYTSPVTGAEYINPEQTIILKTGTAFDEKSIFNNEITIVGSESMDHSFTWKISYDLKTLIIIPDTYFLFGETVTFTLNNGLKTKDGNIISGTQFIFKIKPKDNLQLLRDFYKWELEKTNQLPANSDNEIYNKQFRDVNDLPADYPCPEIENYFDVDENYLFFTLSPRAGAPNYNNYLSINDKYGIPIFFRKRPNNDLYLHKMKDGQLAYARNEYGFPELERYFFMDSSYVVIDSIKTGNGYNMDGHDILLLDNGNYLLMSYDPQPVDMSNVVLGGNPNATVVGLIIQEVDINENVYFQWRSWDHFQITDATSDINLQGTYIDYVHGNAFAFDTDGNLLISSRHLDEITKIDYETGEIIYRFGLLSKNNQFQINNDSYGFSHQHDIRVLQNGNITIYDNGNLHPSPFSRALEYSINELTMTADLVWFYRNDPDIYGSATGSFRRDDEGNGIVGWGPTWPVSATEFLPDNTKSMEVFLPNGVYSYRVIKDYWKTNLFSSIEQLDFGNFDGYNAPKHMVIPVTNNSLNLIRITSSHLHNEVFDVVDDLPYDIPAGDTAEITLSFNPGEQGSFNDRLTLNYDKFSPSSGVERIAIQLTLFGVWDNTLPTVSFIPDYGTNGVSPTSSVYVYFSEPVKKVGGEFITDDDIPELFTFKRCTQWGIDIPFTGTISDDRMQIILTPVEILDEQTSFLVELIPSTIEDDDGDAIDFPEATYFITGVSVDINKDILNDKVVVYPSPMVDKIIVDLPENILYKIVVVDMRGKLWHNEPVSNGKIQIDTKKYPLGVYFINIIGEDGVSTTIKVVKAN